MTARYRESEIRRPPYGEVFVPRLPTQDAVNPWTSGVQGLMMENNMIGLRISLPLSPLCIYGRFILAAHQRSWTADACPFYKKCTTGC
jgi:hypothetical protein